jgi:HEAT repeat protein
LIEPLGLKDILLRRAADPVAEVANRVTLCLAKAIEADRDFGHQLALRLHEREETLVQRAMADVLTRLFRRLTWDALPLLDDMLTSQDEGVLAAASATVGDVKYLDQEQWADRLRQLVNHPLPIVRRNLVPNLREYIEFDPSDARGVFHELWKDGDEVVRIRLRELLIRMEEVAPDHFANQIRALADAGADLMPLWEPMALRDEARSTAWQAWVNGEGEQPTSNSRPVHQSTMEAPESLPALDDALRSLEE